MSKITGIGIALLLVICVPKILSFYDISLSAYGPYLAFLVFIVILAFILPHNFLVTVDTVADAAKNISEGSDASANVGAGGLSANSVEGRGNDLRQEEEDTNIWYSQNLINEGSNNTSDQGGGLTNTKRKEQTFDV